MIYQDPSFAPGVLDHSWKFGSDFWDCSISGSAMYGCRFSLNMDSATGRHANSMVSSATLTPTPILVSFLHNHRDLVGVDGLPRVGCYA